MLHESWQLIIEGKTMPVVLTFKEKIAFLKILCSSTFVSDEERVLICDRVFALVAKGLIFNDLVNRCEWGTPDIIKKTQLWTMISDPFNEDPMQVYFWKEDAFCQHGSQSALMTPFLDAFYE